MAHEGRTVVKLRAGSLDEGELRVRRVHGCERLSEAYWLEVDFVPVSGEFLNREQLLGADGTLSVRRPGGAERRVHGELKRVELTGVAAGRPSYRVRLVPRLERLKHGKRSRIFQEKSVPEIVGQVLDEHGVKHRLALAERYAKREYSVQYQESDYQYVCRLLEDEGIWFWFDHGPQEHELVLADGASGGTQITGEPAVPYRVPNAAADRTEDEHLDRLERAYRLRPEKVELRDYDFERPQQELSGKSQIQDGRLGLEVYEYPGGFRDARDGAKRAQRRLEELQVGAATFCGESTCLRLLPGARFEVEGYGDPSFNQELLLVEVRHEGEQQEGAGEAEGIAHRYHNAFTALEASVPYRPMRRTPRPKAKPTTAWVVGPSNEEVHVDQYGRIQVQFHWDREGEAADGSSCWMRVAQAWAGPGWGAQYTPRVGQEVRVEFVDGDPDRPLVMGNIYNGQNRPSIHLPHDKSQSTLRSATTPGESGSNELRFEDLKDGEELYLHAQRNETIEVENDKTQQVGAGEALSVGKNRSIEVRGNQQLSVDQDDRTSIGVSQTLGVTGSRETKVSGSHTETVGVAKTVMVGGSQTATVDAASIESVGAAAALNVGGAYAVNVGGALNKAVAGAYTGQVGGWRLEAVGLAREERVGKDSEAKVGKDFATDVKGAVFLTTEKDQQEEIAGRQEIEVKGSVSLSAKELEWEAAEKISVVVGGKLVLSLDNSGIQFFGRSLTVDGKEIALKGAQVKKVAAGAAESVELPRSTSQRKADWVEFELLDERGNPIADKAYEVLLRNGSVKKGRLDAKGKARIEGIDPAGSKVVFPEE